MRSFGPLLDTSAIRGKNMKHSDYNKGTSPTTGDARPVPHMDGRCWIVGLGVGPFRRWTIRRIRFWPCQAMCTCEKNETKGM